MNLALDFVTDFVTSYADENGVSVPTDFDPAELLATVNESLILSNGFAFDDFERLSDFSLSLEVETTRLLGI
jgi:hypothetical protein